VLRLGRFIGLRGPGMIVIIPLVDTLSRSVDQRVRVASVSAESTLTRDTVPVNVDAIVFWVVWNAEKSVLEVQDFTQAIELSAQTALRESIGRHELHQMVAEREMLGRELQRILDEKTTPWGITVQSVEIRDVQIPQALQDAMSREAQAERERRARTILGLAEMEIADSFAKAASTYQDNPVALQSFVNAHRWTRLNRLRQTDDIKDEPILGVWNSAIQVHPYQLEPVRNNPIVCNDRVRQMPPVGRPIHHR